MERGWTCGRPYTVRVGWYPVMLSKEEQKGVYSALTGVEGLQRLVPRISNVEWDGLLGGPLRFTYSSTMEFHGKAHLRMIEDFAPFNIVTTAAPGPWRRNIQDGIIVG